MDKDNHLHIHIHILVSFVYCACPYFSANPDWGPIIADDFIATFPNQPLRGNTVRLECLAYGT